LIELFIIFEISNKYRFILDFKIKIKIEIEITKILEIVNTMKELNEINK
jgi:hypothetical protein